MVADPLNRAFAPTVPDDLNDPPRFSQLTETAKDAFVLELRKFFANSQQTAARRFELPTIEKYAAFGDGNDPMSTAATIVRKYPERLEHLPHVAVLSSSGAERKLTIGPPYVATVQDPAFVLAPNAEPYALNDGDVLAFRLMLSRAKDPVVEELVFTADRFPTAAPIGAALAVDVARVINEQAVHLFASVVNVGGFNHVKVECGGPGDRESGQTPLELEVDVSSVNAEVTLGLARRGTAATIGGAQPNMTLTAPAGAWSSADVGRYVTVVGSTNPYFNDGRFLITAFSTASGTDTLTFTSKYGRTESPTTASWFIGLRDDLYNPAHPPKNRYGMAADLTVQVDVLNEDENTRNELADLVSAFFGFFLESKYFTFWGRTGFSGQTVTGEYYQVVLNPPLRSIGETELPRPGDGTGKLYVNSFSVGVTISMYIDRELFFPGTSTPFVVTETTLQPDETLPIPGSLS